MDSSNAGTGMVFSFEQIAIQGGEMPDDLNRNERWMFLCLRELYRQKRVGIIDRETAVAEKKKLVRSYENDCKLSQLESDLIAHYNTVNRQVSALCWEFRKNPSIELANRIIKIFSGQTEVEVPHADHS